MCLRMFLLSLFMIEYIHIRKYFKIRGTVKKNSNFMKISIAQKYRSLRTVDVGKNVATEQ